MKIPGIKFFGNPLEAWATTLPGAWAYSILAGVVGVVVLVMFFAGVYSADGLTKYLPWIIAFNAAVSGYSLLDKARDRLAHKWLSALGCGLAMVLVSDLLIHLALRNDTPITIPGFMFHVLIGMGFSTAGSRLAVKYHDLSK